MMAEKTEKETLRDLLQAAMNAEKYNKARQYMYLIETIEEGDEDESPMMMS